MRGEDNPTRPGATSEVKPNWYPRPVSLLGVDRGHPPLLIPQVATPAPSSTHPLTAEAYS